MATDRELLKAQQIGQFTTSGATDPAATVKKAHEETFRVVNVAGSPLAEVVVLAVVKACRVKSIRATAGSTLAVDPTNFVTGTVAKRDGAGGSATTIGTFKTETTGGAALTALVPTTVTPVAAAVDLAVGEVLTYKLVDAATTTEPAVSVEITVEYI
jgi:hypothetical protein